MLTYRTNESLKRWREGRFRMLQLPRIHRSQQVMPRELWGTRPWRLASRHDPDAPTVIELVGSPEGLVVVGRCTTCGGRGEAIADFSSLVSETPGTCSAEELSRSRSARQLLYPAVDSVAQAMESHSRCRERPTHLRCGQSLKRFTNAVIGHSRAAFARRGEIPGHLHVLFDDDGAAALPFQSAIREGPGTAGRLATAAQHLCRIRRRLQSLQPEAVGAVLAGEAWAGEVTQDELEDWTGLQQEYREEVLLTSIVTPTEAFVNIIPLRELSEGASSDVSTMAWQPVTSPSPLIDGLFAHHQVVSDHSERREVRE